MVTKEPVLTENAPPPMGGLLSQGIVANGFIFTSGAIAQDPQTGEIVSEDIEEQTVSRTSSLSLGLLLIVEPEPMHQKSASHSRGSGIEP